MPVPVPVALVLVLVLLLLVLLLLLLVVVMLLPVVQIRAVCRSRTAARMHLAQPLQAALSQPRRALLLAAAAHSAALPLTFLEIAIELI
eukprot:COSAG06_NODE_25563_length_633_cov_194.741573_1_plen_89_part_00